MHYCATELNICLSTIPNSNFSAKYLKKDVHPFHYAAAISPQVVRSKTLSSCHRSTQSINLLE